MPLERPRWYDRRVRSPWLVLAACSYSPVPAELPADTTPPPDSFNAAAQCPPDYSVVLPDQTSRYRLILTGARYWEHSDDCKDDLEGATHLVAIDSAAELEQVELAVTAAGNIDDNRAWVGGVQLRDQAAPGNGWLWITGGPVDLALWDGGEPNDVGGNEDNQENFISVERDRDGLYDFGNGNTTGALCECDGKPVDPAAAAAIDANRQ